MRAASLFGARAHAIPVAHNAPPSPRVGRAKRFEGLDGHGQIDTLKPFGSSVLFKVFLNGENRVAQINPSRRTVSFVRTAARACDGEDSWSGAWPMSARRDTRRIPANDNERRHKPLGVVVEIAPDLPVQMVEVEVFAQTVGLFGYRCGQRQ